MIHAPTAPAGTVGAFLETHSNMLHISNIVISLSDLGNAPLDPRLEPYRVKETNAPNTTPIPFTPASQNLYEDLYQFVVEELPKHDSFIAHAAVIKYDGLAYSFMAPSGTGKSTHIKLWMDTFGPKATVINGDKPILRLDKTPTGEPQITACGSPWAGKEGWQTNTSAPLAGLCFLTRGSTDECQRISPTEAFDSAVRQIYMPSDPVSAVRTLDFVDVLLQTVPLYRLSCTMNKTAVKASFEAMTGRDFESCAKGDQHEN